MYQLFSIPLRILTCKTLGGLIQGGGGHWHPQLLRRIKGSDWSALSSRPRKIEGIPKIFVIERLNEITWLHHIED